jgi:hypothetical protein
MRAIGGLEDSRMQGFEDSRIRGCEDSRIRGFEDRRSAEAFILEILESSNP